MTYLSVQVSNVFVSFGRKDNHLPEKRVSKKELGGGTILDWGVYCIQFILKAYKGERPHTVGSSYFCQKCTDIIYYIRKSIYFY